MIKFKLTVFFFLSFLASHAKFNGFTADTPNAKIHCHLSLSLKPFVNWINPIDSGGHFFNSPVMFEPGFSYKNHNLVFGFNYSRKKNNYTLNSLPNQKDIINYSISPSYHYRVLAWKRGQVFMGAAFIYNFIKDDYWMLTPLEVITKNTTTIEKGFAPYIRFNYRLNKYLSFETETACYFTKSSFNYVEDYPLTPSLGKNSNNDFSSTNFSIPSKILFKISF